MKKQPSVSIVTVSIVRRICFKYQESGSGPALDAIINIKRRQHEYYYMAPYSDCLNILAWLDIWKANAK
tara:strand:+ start:1211 stop:1417 length:207 start_codon:yes stop_codon:yes gene_type:complete